MKKKTNPRRQPATKADIAKAKQAATRDAMIMSIAVPLMALHDVYGFGPKRLEAVCERMLQMYADESAGLFSAEEANRWMAEYAGIEVEKA